MAKRKSAPPETSAPPKNAAAAKYLPLLRRYGVAALAVAVVVVQMILITQGLTRWRGGGFGMYSDYPWDRTKVFVTFRAQPRDVQKSEDMDRLMARVKRFPNHSNMRALAKEVSRTAGIPDFSILVYQPGFDPATGVFTLTLEKEYNNQNGGR